MISIASYENNTNPDVWIYVTTCKYKYILLTQKEYSIGWWVIQQ